MSRPTPCFVALWTTLALLLVACSHPSSDPGAGAPWPGSEPPGRDSGVIAKRLATSIPTDVVPCAVLEGLRAAHTHLDDPSVHLEFEHPDGTVAERTRALTVLLDDPRFAAVQWEAATLTATHLGTDPARAVFTLRFPRSMKVPTTLGLPDDPEGDATTTTGADGLGPMRPVSPQEADRFAAALEIEATVDLGGRPPAVAYVDARTLPTMCLLSEVPPSLR